MSRSVDVTVSFECFPPADPSMQDALWHCIGRLAPLGPNFISVTCGADGSTRERTHDLVTRIQEEKALSGAAHLTCVGASREDIARLARSYWARGIRHIVALRGDPPGGTHRFEPHPQGFARAADLVAALRAIAPFEISVAAYPETHPEAASAQADIEALKSKMEAGADRAITQFFYDTDRFLRFRDRCAARGIAAPLVPGILPINRFAQVLRMARRCGTRIPAWLHQRFEGLDEDPETCRLVAASVAISQVSTLLRHGIAQFHFYTLNRPELSYAICHVLGLRPRTARAHS